MLGGLDEFLPYIKEYATTFQGKSITTEDWKAHLYAYWEKHGGPEKIKALDSIKWDVCFSTPLAFPIEIPDVRPKGMAPRRGPQAPRRDGIRHRACPRRILARREVGRVP